MFSSSFIVRAFRKTVICAVAFSMTATALRANDLPSGSDNAPIVGGQPPMTRPAAADTLMSFDKIGEALDVYGRSTITNNGYTYYDLNIKRGDWNFKLFVEVSPNKRVVYITAPLTDIPDLSKVSTTALASLLQKNSDTGTTFFQMAGKNHKVELVTPIQAAGLTPEKLQGTVENLLTTIQNTHELWKAETLIPAATNPLEAPAAVR